MNEEPVSASYTTPAVPDPEGPEPLSRRDWLAPLLALCLGWLYVSVFGADTALNVSFGPGIGVTAFVFAFFAAVFLMLGSSLRRDAAGFLLMAGALCLSLCCGIYSHLGLTVTNCFLILCLSAAAVFRLSGHSRRSWRDWRLLPETLVLSLEALFSRLGRPFQALVLWRPKKSDRLGGFLPGLLIALPVLALVVLLLSSADAVFADIFVRLGLILDELEPGPFFSKVLRIVIWSFPMCSGLYFISTPPRPRKPEEPRERSYTALPFLAVTVLLDAVYILFVIIQFTHLFGGRYAAAMAGGWAQYARTGFFQLVAVTLINLCVCLLPAHTERCKAPGGRLLRAAAVLMTALSFIILASGAWRMRLYIQVWGMSVLRLLTLWGMAVIAVLLGAAVYKLCRPQFRFFQVFVTFAVGSWCLLQLLGPARLTAEYNVNAYLDGRQASVDVEYLDWPEALPALYRLEDAAPETEGLQGQIKSLERECEPDSHYRWHWSYWRASLLLAEDFRA